MKKIFFTALLLLLATQAFCQTNKIVSSIQYDGVYIEVGAKQFVQLSEAPPAFVARYHVPELNTSSWPDIHITDGEKKVEVKTIKKIIFSGFSADDMKYLSIHPAQMISRRDVILYSEGREATNYYTYKGETRQMRTPLTCKANVTKIRENYYEATLPEGISSTESYVIWIKKRFWFFKSSTSVVKKTVVKVKTPTAMGAYVKEKNQLFTPLITIEQKFGRYSEYRTSCECYTDIFGKGLGMFSRNDNELIEEELIQKHRNTIQNFNSATFEGIVVKGNYDFGTVAIRKIEEITGNQKQSFVTTESVKIEAEKLYLVFGAGVTLQRQTNGDVCTFTLSKTLEKGDYTVNIGKTHWIFSIK